MKRRYLPTEVLGELSQHDHTIHRDMAAIDGWYEPSVANPTFLLVILGC